jgi:tRNA (guanine-N7-)-methyltransferase
LPPTSVILDASQAKAAWLTDTHFGKPTICFRVPNDDELISLLKVTGPLAAPSANLPDLLPARNVAEAENYFGENVKLYVSSGECENHTPSRIIKFRRDGTVETLRSDGLLHPEDFVITRRRKQYKFAKFNEYSSCFHLEEWLDQRDSLLNQLSKLVVEIGAGSAGFSVELARRHKDTTFVAVDIKGDRLYQGARDALADNLENVFFVRADIAQINDVIPAGLASEIWLTFPDPYPRKSDAKHRLTAPRYLEYYQQILKPNGLLHFKTDNVPLFDWSLEQFAAKGWQTEFLTRDLHSSDASAEAKIMTTYEKRFIEEGLTINYTQQVFGEPSHLSSPRP